MKLYHHQSIFSDKLLSFIKSNFSELILVTRQTMGVQIETIKAGDGVTFPQNGQKVNFLSKNLFSNSVLTSARFLATMC